MTTTQTATIPAMRPVDNVMVTAEESRCGSHQHTLKFTRTYVLVSGGEVATESVLLAKGGVGVSADP